MNKGYSNPNRCLLFYNQKHVTCSIANRQKLQYLSFNYFILILLNLISNANCLDEMTIYVDTILYLHFITT